MVTHHTLSVFSSSQADRQLHTGQITHEEHQKLLSQLEDLYQFQKSKEEQRSVPSLIGGPRMRSLLTVAEAEHLGAGDLPESDDSYVMEVARKLEYQKRMAGPKVVEAMDVEQSGFDKPAEESPFGFPVGRDVDLRVLDPSYQTRMQKSVGDQKPDAKEDGESAVIESVAKTEVTEKASKEEQEKQKEEKEIVSSQSADEEKKKEVPAASPKNEEMISPMSPPPEDRDERIKAVVVEKVAEESSGKEDQGGSEKKSQGAEGKELSIKEDSKVARGDVDHRLTKENSDVDERKVEHSRDVDGAKIDVDLRKDKTESKKDVDDRKVSDIADGNIQKQDLKNRRGPAAGEDVDERFNSLEEEKEDGKKKATEKDVDDRRIAVGDSEESTKVEVKMTIKDTDERKLDKTDHDAREQTKDDRGKDEKKQISSDPVSSAKDKSTTNIESQKEQEEEATAKMDVDERNDSAKGDLSKADSSDSKPINHIAEDSTVHPGDKVIPTDKDKRSKDPGIVEEKTDDGSEVNKKVRQPRDDLLPAAFRDAVEPSAVDQDLRDLDAYTRGPNDASPRARNWGDVPRNFFDAEGKRGADVTEVREDIDLRGYDVILFKSSFFLVL